MRQLIRHIVFLLGTLSPALLCIAQPLSPAQYERDSLYRHIAHEGFVCQVFRLSYRLNSSEILSGLGSNSAELSRLTSFIHSAMSYPHRDIERIRLTGYSSIDGYYFSNSELARNRAYSMLHYLHFHFPGLTRYPFDVAWVAEDWDGLSRLVKASDLDEREEVLDIIRKVQIFDGRESLLMYLNGGRAYREMERTMFPLLRRVELEVVYSNRELQAVEVDSVATEAIAEAVAETIAEAIAKNRSEEAAEKMGGNVVETVKESRRIFSLKTNLIPWTGVMADFKHTTYLANLALEYYCTPRWSVEAGAMYSYWKFNSDKEFQGISGYRIESRWWVPLFSRSVDMYLGAYGRLGDYDIRKEQIVESENAAQPTPLLPEEGCPQGGVVGVSQQKLKAQNSTGRYHDFGLSAGLYIYLTPAWGVEIGARGGYVHSNAILYTEKNTSNWLTGRKGYYRLRVTDLNVSLVYRFR